MSLTYITECDCCHKKERGWPPESNLVGWYRVHDMTQDDHDKDYCADCWPVAAKALERARKKP